MPLQYGELIDHISRVFGGRGWQRLQDIEWEADTLLKDVGRPSSDRFNLPLRDLPRVSDVGRGRDDIIMDRTRLFDLESIFAHLDESPAFRMRKEATVMEQGYGHFTLPREAFVEATSVEDIRARLAFTAQTIQAEKVGAAGVELRMAGSTPRAAFLEDAAQQAFNADTLRNAKRLVFDVETAGLETDKGIWQLSARLMEGDSPIIDAATGNEKTINLLFRNNMMDLGAYGIDDAGRVTNFEQFYEGLRRGGEAIDWIEPENFAAEMTRFLNMANEADYLVGQNTAFDVRQLLHGMEGQIKSSPEFAKAVEGFKRQIAEGRVVDTRMLSMMVFGGDHTLNIAPELRRVDKFTPHSMENILLESSFLEDLARDLDRQGLKGWDEIKSRISQGMHHGDVDTWFEDHLFRMQADVLSGQRSDILTSASLADSELRRLISKAAAITPFTRIPGLGGEGVNYTPIEMLVHHQRRMEGTVLQESSNKLLREGGLFQNWADDILTQEGRLSRMSQLTDSGYDAIQARAIRQGLPFAGLSSFERLVSTALGGAGPAEIRGMGDLTASAVVQTADQVNIFGGRNVALPMELIKAAEQSHFIDPASDFHKQPALRSRFASAMDDQVSALQTARWSAFEWGDGQRDLALVADIISSQEDVDRLTAFMKSLSPEDMKKYGLTPSKIDEVASVLSRHGEKYGIQVGILGGKDDRNIQNVARLMEQLGFDVDSKTAHMRTAVFEADGRLMTTASMLDRVMSDATRATSMDDFFTEHAGRILEETRLSKQMVEQIMSPDLDPNIRRAIFLGRGDPTRTNRIYSFLDDNLPNLRGRHLAYAGVGLAGYYMFRKRRDQAIFDETLSQQEYEDPMFYEQYRAELGEETPQDYRIRPSQEALNTAGMVQSLDRNKTRHHAMGSNKHSHLFGG